MIEQIRQHQDRVLGGMATDLLEAGQEGIQSSFALLTPELLAVLRENVHHIRALIEQRLSESDLVPSQRRRVREGLEWFLGQLES